MIDIVSIVNNIIYLILFSTMEQSWLYSFPQFRSTHVVKGPIFSSMI